MVRRVQIEGVMQHENHDAWGNPFLDGANATAMRARFRTRCYGQDASSFFTCRQENHDSSREGILV